MKQHKHKIDRQLACKMGIAFFNMLAEQGYTIVKLEESVESSPDKQTFTESVERIEYLYTQPDGSKVAINETRDTTVNKLINEFKHVNPAYESFFMRKGDRAVLHAMLKQYPADTLFQLLAVLPQTNSMQYAPIVTTPREFYRLAPKLVAFIQKKKSEQASGFKVSI